MDKPAHLLKGQKGEDIAAEFLRKKGFEILARNFRFKRAEIDLIARKGNLTAFVEVKLRKNNRFGQPESFISPKKEELIHSAALAFLEENPSPLIRFDIVSISEFPQLEIVHFEDAF